MDGDRRLRIDERRDARCEACSKSPRVLRQIESGQWLCQTCRRAIAPPRVFREGMATARQMARARKLGLTITDAMSQEAAHDFLQKNEPGSARQIEYARTLGFDVDDKIPKNKINELLDFHRAAKWYVCDVWEDLTGRRPKDSDIPWNDLTHFACRLIDRYGLGARIHAIETERFEAAWQEELRRDALGEVVEFKACVPPIRKDDTYREVAELMCRRYANRSRFRRFLWRILGRG